MIAKARLWWAGREPRERKMLMAGSAVALVLGVYLAVWEPIASASARLTDELPKLRVQAADFSRQAAEAERLRASSQSRGPVTSIQSAVQESAPRFNVQGAVKSVQQLAPDRAQVAMGPVAFDPLVRWLGDLGQSSGIAVETLQIGATAEQGKVAVETLVLRTMRGQ